MSGTSRESSDINKACEAYLRSKGQPTITLADQIRIDAQGGKPRKKTPPEDPIETIARALEKEWED